MMIARQGYVRRVAVIATTTMVAAALVRATTWHGGRRDRRSGCRVAGRLSVTRPVRLL